MAEERPTEQAPDPTPELRKRRWSRGELLGLLFAPLALLIGFTLTPTQRTHGATHSSQLQSQERAADIKATIRSAEGDSSVRPMGR